ncbi:hypothetical protein QTI66_23215 [Variovorax sp. J22R133]|uniref:hypothetical protein n=1 Tax=Variovorax brevis TaxID=3053503 RepID=UPI002577EFFF|nr:hypothetical protein [Variovorax sp. J22R133]MDM0115078.1 hypothetical protein [Variovorax sp. J22R133]
MNRCVKFPSKNLPSIAVGYALLVSSALWLHAPAQAQDQSIQTQNEAAVGGRNFPVGTLRGQITFVNAQQVLLDGQPARLSPGSRVQSAQRMLVMPAALVGQTYVVNYMKDTMGLVSSVWLLSTDEARTERQSAERPFFNFWPFVANTGPRDDGNTPFDQLPRYGQ